MKWICFKHQMPEFEQRILCYWAGLDHVEDARIFKNEDVPGHWYCVLFDGESLNTLPTHWTPLEIPEAQ